MPLKTRVITLTLLVFLSLSFTEKSMQPEYLKHFNGLVNERTQPQTWRKNLTGSVKMLGGGEGCDTVVFEVKYKDQNRAVKLLKINNDDDARSAANELLVCKKVSELKKAHIFLSVLDSFLANANQLPLQFRPALRLSLEYDESIEVINFFKYYSTKIQIQQVM